VGLLCRACAQEVTPCDGLIPDHIRSNTQVEDGAAWVVDGFGVAHAIVPRATIGRSQDGGLVVLAASVSREHAELRKTEEGWQLRDLGSRNGTFVDGQRLQGRATLEQRTLIKIGDVPLWFLAEVAQMPSEPVSMQTQSVGGALVRYMVHHETTELCVVGGGDSQAGGALLSRKASQSWGNERALPRLEFQLLRTLCARAVDEADSPAAVRGTVTTKQLARDLPFQASYPDEENVRQVVRRLRAALKDAGADGVLGVVPGRGYYISCRVTVGG
jgi:DNA-binding response OmpR family regulator